MAAPNSPMAGPGRPPAQQPTAQQPTAQQPTAQQPTALLYGPGQLIVHGNPAFKVEFGEATIGLPAREALTAVPATLFHVVERVRALGRPLACWLLVAGERRRLTVAPRRDPETDEVYGVALRLARA